MVPLGREPSHLCPVSASHWLQAVPLGLGHAVSIKGKGQEKGTHWGPWADKTQKRSDVSGEKGVRLGRESGSGADGPGLEEQFKEEAWEKTHRSDCILGASVCGAELEAGKRRRCLGAKPSPLPHENKLSFLLCSPCCLYTSGCR